MGLLAAYRLELPADRSLGKMRLIMGRKNGRQEHMMATLHSAAVQ